MGWFSDILSGIGDFVSDAVSGFFDIFSSSGDNNNRTNRQQNNSRRNRNRIIYFKIKIGI